MDAKFWHERWEANEIGFHQSQANPLLVAYFNELSLSKGSRVFVPLCGKTLDISWFLANDCRVAGAELSEIAITQLFDGLSIEPKIRDLGTVKHYSAPNIDVFAGDIFDLTREMIGPVDAIFDRAALVALPEAVRNRYTKHLIDITDGAPQLLLTYAYDQSLRQGPPFSVSPEEVSRHYQDHYEISALETLDVGGGLRGQILAKETIWHLKRR